MPKMPMSEQEIGTTTTEIGGECVALYISAYMTWKMDKKILKNLTYGFVLTFKRRVKERHFKRKRKNKKERMER